MAAVMFAVVATWEPFTSSQLLVGDGVMVTFTTELELVVTPSGFV